RPHPAQADRVDTDLPGRQFAGENALELAPRMAAVSLWSMRYLMFSRVHRNPMPRGVACFGVVIALLVSVVPSALAITQPPTVPQADRGMIRIDGDSAFTAANGVTGGRGTPSKPYTIEGWNISAAGGDAIAILSTTAYFLV